MADIFNSLPKECISDLNSKQRKLLLQDKEYTLPGGDSIETVQYTIDLDNDNQYLTCEMSFTTGQNGFNVIQVRKFIKKDGSPLIVFSRYGGTTRSYFQNEMRCFSYSNNKLTEIKNKLLPDSIPVARFLKSDTPDSIKSKLESYISTANNLNPLSKDAIVFTIFSQVDDNGDNKYLIGNSMPFIWTGEKFKQSEIQNLD